MTPELSRHGRCGHTSSLSPSSFWTKALVARPNAGHHGQKRPSSANDSDALLLRDMATCPRSSPTQTGRHRRLHWRTTATPNRAGWSWFHSTVIRRCVAIGPQQESNVRVNSLLSLCVLFSSFQSGASVSVAVSERQNPRPWQTTHPLVASCVHHACARLKRKPAEDQDLTRCWSGEQTFS